MLYWEYGPLDSKTKKGVAGPPQSKSTRDEAVTASSESQMDSVSDGFSGDIEKFFGMRGDTGFLNHITGNIVHDNSAVETVPCVTRKLPASSSCVHG